MTSGLDSVCKHTHQINICVVNPHFSSLHREFYLYLSNFPGRIGTTVTEFVSLGKLTQGVFVQRSRGVEELNKHRLKVCVYPALAAGPFTQVTSCTSRNKVVRKRPLVPTLDKKQAKAWDGWLNG